MIIVLSSCMMQAIEHHPVISASGLKHLFELWRIFKGCSQSWFKIHPAVTSTEAVVTWSLIHQSLEPCEILYTCTK